MIRLSSDVDSDVRDWATFGLGALLELDTPAIRSNPDALFINKFSDAMLLVVRPNVSTLDSAAYLKEVLAQSEQTVFAQIINN